jgi:CRISPR-associated protein Csc3
MDGQTALEVIDQLEQEQSELSEYEEVIRDYLRKIDGALIEQGWNFDGAKTIDFGFHDQSLLNHVRNGVFFLVRLNYVARKLDARTLSADELRSAIGMFVAHDLHKTRKTEGPDEEFDIPREVVEEFIEETGLLKFSPDITVDDCWSCACAHHDSWNAKTSHVTVAFDELQSHIRLADAFASSPTPEEAVDQRTRNRFNDVFFGELQLRYHQLTDVKGILTNLCNTAISNLLSSHGYQVLTFYQDGCVYAVPEGTQVPPIDETLINKIYDEFTNTVRQSHHSYSSPTELMDNITTSHLGFYAPSNEDFFYAGPENVLQAVVCKAAQDGDTDDDPTDSMSESIAKVAEVVPIKLHDTRQLVGVARLVYTVHRAIVSEIETEKEDFEMICNLFDVSDEVKEALLDIRDQEPTLLKSGGKWEYSYAIAQELLEREFDGVSTKHLSPQQFGNKVTKFLVDRLSDYNGWETIDESFTAEIRKELVTYFSDILVVDGQSLQMESDLSDQFSEYTGKRGGKICTLCNRGTTGNKSDMETKKSRSTLQAGFSNRVRIGAGKPEQLLMCSPCQIELSLRTAGATRRESGRLFFHFVPDYFYTPLSWELTRGLFARYTGDASVRMGRLAEELFQGSTNEDSYRIILDYLTADEGGMSMIENLAQGFEEGVGTAPVGYFKPHDSETEFQFFGVYLALTIASYTGLRVLVSENPAPELRARDFKEMARLGAGMTPVHRFYGDAVSLNELEPTIKSASALIQLGYENERKDSLFPKYLRATRNKPLPGSYLLKRIAQDNPDEGSRAAWNLMDEAKYLDTTTGVTQIHDSE